MRAAKEAIEADAANMAAEAAAAAIPIDMVQRSFTDPEARMMKTVNGFYYAYNAQAAADEHSQVILTADVTQQAGDVGQFIPMIAAAKNSLTNAGIKGDPKVILADAGYCSEANLQQLSDLEVDAVIITGRIRLNEGVPDAPRGPIPKDATQRERTPRRMRTKSERADHARRKAIVEPVFWQTKPDRTRNIFDSRPRRCQRRMDAPCHLQQPEETRQRRGHRTVTKLLTPTRASSRHGSGSNTLSNEDPCVIVTPIRPQSSQAARIPTRDAGSDLRS